MTLPRPTPRWRQAIAPFACVLALGVALPAVSPRVAVAEDGPDPSGAQSDEEKIKAQMEKILRLMRDNEKALLDASNRGGKKPPGVDVVPPEAPPAMAGGGPEAAKPPEGGTPPEKGSDVRRAIDELIKLTSEKGGSIPKELEELVKMIPT